MAIDPLAVEYHEFSPYNYVENNPINLIDPDGMGPDPSNTCYEWSSAPSISVGGGVLAGVSFYFSGKGAANAFGWHASQTINWSSSIARVQQNQLQVQTGGSLDPRPVKRPHENDWEYQERLKAWKRRQQKPEMKALNFLQSFAEFILNLQMWTELVKTPEEIPANTAASIIDWTEESTAPLVGETANSIDQALGEGTVLSVERNYTSSAGFGDVDISTKNANIEVKSRGKMNLTQSLKNSAFAKSEKKSYYLYMPNTTTAQIKDAAKKGITVIKTKGNLINMLR